MLRPCMSQASLSSLQPSKSSMTGRLAKMFKVLLHHFSECLWMNDWMNEFEWMMVLQGNTYLWKRRSDSKVWWRQHHAFHAFLGAEFKAENQFPSVVCTVCRFADDPVCIFNGHWARRKVDLSLSITEQHRTNNQEHTHAHTQEPFRETS